MNYRHSYHAGNFADVVKHALQLICLDYLQQKEKPFYVLDTHAGIGMYDLQGEQAQKTGEWEHGIGRLLQAENRPACLETYCSLVRSLNPGDNLRWYPGSPWLSQQFLRDNDQLGLCELHPDDAEELADNFSRDKRVKVYGEENGYIALKALLPPPQKRGLVLIDPPFETTTEFNDIVTGLKHALKRWNTGSYVIWYPIKDPIVTGGFQQMIRELAPPKAYAVDLLIRHAEDATKLNGCGMLFINPPFGLLEPLAELMPFLTELLAQGEGASWQGHWVVAES
ncbi:MAG: 23S rRNA (adenine(2030)-N(6))-methyltransferase RlmJ [Idiomarina sp.]